MVYEQEIEERILHALCIPYKTGLISKDLQEHINIKKNSGDEKRFHRAKKSLIRDGILVFEKFGTKKIYYLPQYTEEVFSNWNIPSEIDLSLRIAHAKKIQELVIKPLLEKYKDAKPGFEYNIDKKSIKEEYEWGISYEKIISVDLDKSYKKLIGLPGPYMLKAKNKFLLNDYIENHAPGLSKLINEFNDLYNDLWEYYYNINDEVRNIIYKITKLPIYTWDMVNFGNCSKKENHVTTNLQFEIIHKFGLYDYTYRNEQAQFSYSIRLKNHMYECYSEEYEPHKIFIRVKENDLEKKDISTWIDNTISKILSETIKSVKIKRLSKKYSSTINKYINKRTDLLDFLENDLIKEVFDGVCDYCIS